jgi:hypothetical protein
VNHQIQQLPGFCLKLQLLDTCIHAISFDDISCELT